MSDFLDRARRAREIQRTETVADQRSLSAFFERMGDPLRETVLGLNERAVLAERLRIERRLTAARRFDRHLGLHLPGDSALAIELWALQEVRADLEREHEETGFCPFCHVGPPPGHSEGCPLA